jgi:hypothetical protein
MRGASRQVPRIEMCIADWNTTAGEHMSKTITIREITLADASTVSQAKAAAARAERRSISGIPQTQRYALMTLSSALITLEGLPGLVNANQSAVIPICSPNDVVETVSEMSFMFTGPEIAEAYESGITSLLARVREVVGNSVIHVAVGELPKPDDSGKDVELMITVTTSAPAPRASYGSWIVAFV